MGSEPISGERPRVVMLVANRVEGDSRVLKSATSLGVSGADVTLIGLAEGAERQTLHIQGARIIRVPLNRCLSPSDTGRTGAVERLRGALKTKVPAQTLREQRLHDRAVMLDRRHDHMVAIAPLRDLEARAASAAEHGSPLATVQRGLLFVAIKRHTLLMRYASFRYRWKWARDQFEFPELLPLGPTGLRADWKRALPVLSDIERAMWLEIKRANPDVVHAHDMSTLSIAARAVMRIQTETGRRVPLVYDAHEYVRGLNHFPRPKYEGYVQLESEFIHRAAKVITVSPDIAERLQADHELPETPTVVLNAPVRRPLGAGMRTVRDDAGVGPDVKLAVYSGGIAAERGLETLVDALALLPGDVHLALVTVPEKATDLVSRAATLGCLDRLTVHPYVPAGQVSGYLSGADIGVHPMIAGIVNHEVALPNKLFEYLHAGLPMVVTELQAMGRFVRAHGVGTTFVSGDARSLADAMLKAFAAQQELAINITSELQQQYSWDEAHLRLVEVYRDVLRAPALSGAFPDDPDALTLRGLSTRPRPALRRTPSGRRTVVIGPANSAGQAHALARAVHDHDSGISGSSQALFRPGHLNFPCDVEVSPQDYRQLEWQVSRMQEVLSSDVTHAILESGLGLFGTLNGGDLLGDLPALRHAGIRVAALFHGSDIRSPGRHAELEPDSPYHDQEFADRLRARVERNHQQVRESGIDVFVTTTDLLDYVPGATWLPAVIDIGAWQGGRPVRTAPPFTVVHVPSSPHIKGTSFVQRAAEELERDGLFEVVLLQDVAPEDMPGVIGDADIVLDQFRLGDYGVMACQGMAAGRVVVGHVSERSRARIGHEVPIVQSSGTSLAQTLRELVRDPGSLSRIGQQGQAYAQRFHDGSYSGRVIAEWMRTMET